MIPSVKCDGYMETPYKSLDPYGFQHLSAHLFDVDLDDDLYRVTTLSGWCSASIRFDPSATLYRQDLDRAFKAAVRNIEPNDQPVEAQATAPIMVQPMVLAWLSSRHGQASRLVSSLALVAMARLGDVEQAIRRAENIPDPILRSQALIQVGGFLVITGKKSKALSLFFRAKEILWKSQKVFFDDKLSTLALLTGALINADRQRDAHALAILVESEVEAETARTGGSTLTSADHIDRASIWGHFGDKQRVLAAAAPWDDTQFLIGALAAGAKSAFKRHPNLANALLDTAQGQAMKNRQPPIEYELALVLAGVGRMAEALRVAGVNPTEIGGIRLSAACAMGAIQMGDTENGHLMLAETIAAALALEPSPKQLPLIEELAWFGLRTNNGMLFKDLAGRIAKIQGMFSSELSSSDLGCIAFAMAVFGDERLARAAVDAALNWQPMVDIWEENTALRILAELLGIEGDREGLAWILMRAAKCREGWQQAELASALVSAFRTADDTARAAEAEKIMCDAALGKNSSAWRINAKGVLAVWAAKEPESSSKKKDHTIVTEIVTQIQKDNNSPDDLSCLAQTLAEGGARNLAQMVLSHTIAAIKSETDPNTVARTIGAAAETAALIKDAAIIGPLSQIAKTIEDQWLQAEALFWLAGWQTQLDDWHDAQKNYYEAAATGLERPMQFKKIELIWKRGALEYVEDVAVDIGWPSTLAAALFSGLMLAMQTPKADCILQGLQILEKMTEGYNHIRYVCHRVLVRAAVKLADQGVTAIRYWIDALAYNKIRDEDELWAVIGACLPVLYTRFGGTVTRLLWTELARVQGLRAAPI